jgi:hypothetical protein
VLLILEKFVDVATQEWYHSWQRNHDDDQQSHHTAQDNTIQSDMYICSLPSE